MKVNMVNIPDNQTRVPPYRGQVGSQMSDSVSPYKA